MAQKMTTLTLRCRLPWVCAVSGCDQFTSLLHQTTWRARTGQNSNAGMLPPSDSDEDSEVDKVPVKAKQVTVNQVSRTNFHCCVCALPVCEQVSTMCLPCSRLLLACCPLATLKRSQAQRRRQSKSPRQAQLANLPVLLLRLQAKSMPSVFVDSTKNSGSQQMFQFLMQALYIATSKHESRLWG